MSKYPKLDEYIKKAKAEGKTDDQLRVEMKSAGYNEEDIQSVFSSSESAPKSTNRISGSLSNNTNLNTPTPNKKNKILSIILTVVITILVLGGVFYVWNTGVFAGAPYDEDNLFSGLAKKISKMETYSYSLSGSFYTEDRESDAEPFEPIGNSIELKEKYNRDYQRVQFVNRFYAVYGRKSLKSLESGTDRFININDPLTGEVYDYRLTENGENWEISIEFETSQAIKSAIEGNKRAEQWKVEPVDIDGQTITFTKDTSSINFPSKPPQNFYESINESLESIPENIKAEASVVFKSNMKEENPDFSFDISAEGDLGDLIYKVDANAIKKDEDLYLKVNNFPSIFLFFFPVPKGEWILVEEDSFLNNFVPENEIVENKESRGEVNRFYRKALDSADKNNLLAITNNPKKEKVGDRSAYRYELQINKDGIKPFLEEIIYELENGNYPNIKSYLSDLEILQDYTEKEEFSSVLDYYNKNTKNTLWVNNAGYIVKFESSNRLVPSSERLSEKQFILVLSVELDDINKTINIEAPENYKTLEEIEESYESPLSEARDKGADAAIKSYLSNIRAEAELAYDANGNSYGKEPFEIGTCKPLENTLFAESGISGLIEGATSHNNKDGSVCVSEMSGGAVKSWAVSVPLVSDSDYSFCVDSSGNAMEIVGSIKGDTCDGSISKKKDNTVKKTETVVQETIETDPVIDIKTEAEIIDEKTQDKTVYYGNDDLSKCFQINYSKQEEREKCFTEVENKLYESQKKISLGEYDLCGKDYEIQKRSFNNSFNAININDIAKLYSDLANKEEIGLFCDEFEGFFEGHKVGIAIENFRTEPDGNYDKKIRFYKLFDNKILNNPYLGFTTKIDYFDGDIQYLPEINPGEFRKNNPGGGYTTSWVSLGDFR